MGSTLVADITRTSHDIMRFLKRRMTCVASDDLHMGQLHALACVHRKGGMTMSQLADALHVSSPSATTFVDRLVDMKYLSRTHDNQNRRIVRLKVTASGKSALSRKMAEKQKMVAEVLYPLSEADKREFLRILQIILNSCNSY